MKQTDPISPLKSQRSQRSQRSQCARLPPTQPVQTPTSPNLAHSQPAYKPLRVVAIKILIPFPSPIPRPFKSAIKKSPTPAQSAILPTSVQTAWRLGDKKLLSLFPIPAPIPCSFKSAIRNSFPGFRISRFSLEASSKNMLRFPTLYGRDLSFKAVWISMYEGITSRV